MAHFLGRSRYRSRAGGTQWESNTARVCYPNRVDYSLLFIDLDGTLVGAGDMVSARTIAALNKAQEAGCTIVISTARNRFMVERVAAQWHGHGYAILSNGAIIAEWETGKVIRKIPLPLSVVHHAARIAHSFEAAPLCFGVHAEEDGGERVYTDSRFPIAPKYLARNGGRLAYEDDIETIRDLAPVGMGAYGPRERIEALALAWAESLGPNVAVFDSLDPKYDCWCAFLNLKEADKASAAKRVADLLGVPRERTMSIGDHLNDLELLCWTGLGVCMGDGHDEARARAGHVTGTLAEDGVAMAIERFILGLPITERT